ncbi:RING-H2 finger protein ATL54-like [Abrus precatorius]|uniref:RING-type E3 ubiquitin transferase n=1 Tax=Abrus precatorius TaxID=3816 RepID=A0A8B8JJM2_ABRPR|nr:RING-H2 finger protein ATL54-like [Abrus precatorius]
MEIKHRKLFPSDTTTNQTQDCYGFCDPACPYNCYSNPDYFFSPPPPPSSISEHSNQVNHISSYLIILVTLFTVIFLVVAFYVIKVKCYADWCGWRFNGSVPSQTDNTEEFLNENQVDHPVWLITTVGLQQSIINSITVCKYKKDEGLIEGTECSVCLNEFQEEETLRLLPKCNHAFHIPCIDTWLRSHTNCPLCRAGIVSSNVAPDSATSNFASTEQENANFARNHETLLENSINDGEFSSNMVINVAMESRTGTGESSEGLEFIDESNYKERVNDSTENQIEKGSVSSDSILEENSCSTESESKCNHVVDHVLGDSDTQLHMVNLWKQKQDGDCYSKTYKSMRRSSIEECLHMSPVSMKRSFSCNGRILSSRGYVSLNSRLNSSSLEFSIGQR